MAKYLIIYTYTSDGHLMANWIWALEPPTDGRGTKCPQLEPR